jgi:hypothetical protein
MRQKVKQKVKRVGKTIDLSIIPCCIYKYSLASSDGKMIELKIK